MSMSGLCSGRAPRATASSMTTAMEWNARPRLPPAPPRGSIRRCGSRWASSVTSPSGYSAGPSGSSLTISSTTASTWSSVNADTGTIDSVHQALLERLNLDQVLGQRGRLTRVALGRQRDELGPLQQLGDLPDEELVAGADALVGRQAHADDIDLGPGLVDQIVEPLPQRPRPVQAGVSTRTS